MKNILILHGDRPNYWVVTGDHERFTNEILFEGHKFSLCLDYIKRENGDKKWKAKVIDPWNSAKGYEIFHYADGHYRMAEYVYGKKYGKTYRVRKVNVMDVINGICDYERKRYY